MALSMLLLIICAFMLLFLITHSKYGIPLFFLIMGIVLTTITVLFQYYSSSSYTPPSYFPFRALDLYLYRKLGRTVRIPMTHMQRIRNCGITLYLWGCTLFTITIRRNRTLDKNGKLPLRLFSTIIIPAIISLGYCTFYSPTLAYRLYIYSCKLSSDEREQFTQLLNIIHQFSNIVILAFIFSPLVYMCLQLAKNKITLFKNTIIVLACMMGITNAYFYIFLFIGIFRYSPTDVIRTGFWFFNRIIKIPNVYIASYPIFALVILLFTLLSMTTFYSQDLISLAQKRLLKRRIDDLNENLRDVFHSEKNLMFSINILANEVKNNYGTTDALEKLDRIIGISQKQMDLISDSLNSIKQLHIKPNPVDIRQLTDTALDSISVPDDIRVEKIYCDYPARCTLDTYHSVHAMTNLISNSIDSLETCDDSDKVITITIEASRESVHWSIKDNGTGLDNKSVKKILMPFASTKSKSTNWGIGLPYVYRVVTSQLGQIRMSGSKDSNNHYALVEMVLPRNKS